MAEPSAHITSAVYSSPKLGTNVSNAVHWPSPPPGSGFAYRQVDAETAKLLSQWPGSGTTIPALAFAFVNKILLAGSHIYPSTLFLLALTRTEIIGVTESMWSIKSETFTFSSTNKGLPTPALGQEGELPVSAPILLGR
jgi:hypothetical protein